jgi:uroporphyrinogen-III synthase
MTSVKAKVKSILISQPQPEGKSPYAAIQKKYNLKIDYRPFIHVDEISTIEFREQRISILNHDSVIFTSKHAMDHYFSMCERLRIKVPDYTKYFCVSEAIAHYLQNFITFRKRKIFTGEQTFASLIPVMQKHSDSKFIFPCSDVLKSRPNKSLDLSDLQDVKYDILVFFSPTGIKSLMENFPKFIQEETRLAVFGPTTVKSVEDFKLRVDIEAPNKKAPSMSMALEQYIKESNKRRR